MQKTILYVAVLAILIFGVWYFLFAGQGNIFGNDEAGFSVKDTGNIGKIFLADNAHKSVTLRRTDSGWYVNDHKALLPQVNYLLATLAQQEPVSPVTVAQHNGVISSLAGTHVKVEIYDRKGALLRTFYVGGEVPNFGGTFMLTEGAKRPFVVNIPGYTGYLTPRYSPDLSVWLDRTVFNIGADDITQVAVDYAIQPAQSFALRRNGDSITVTLQPALAATGAQPMNKARAVSYLKFFSRVNGESVVNGLPGLDSVLRTMPKIATVTVRGKNNYAQGAVIYFYPLNRRSKNLGMPIIDSSSYYDADHYYAVVNRGRDTISAPKTSIDKILRHGSEFYEADTVQAPAQSGVLPRGVKMRP